MRFLKIFALVMIVAFSAARAQSPAPIIVQAASSAPAASTSPASVTAAVSSLPDAIILLEQVKAANDEVLAKQKAALERLDELQEAADQLRIFAKRG
jgi:hypothetical protein